MTWIENNPCKHWP